MLNYRKSKTNIQVNQLLIRIMRTIRKYRYVVLNGREEWSGCMDFVLAGPAEVT